MNDLYEKSIHTLELDKVLEQLADCAASEGAKEQIRALRPLQYEDEIERAQSETTAAVKLSGLKGSPSFSGVRDLSAQLARADMGGLLSMKDLLDIAALLRCARNVRAYVSDDERALKTCLDEFFTLLVPNKYFEEKIASSILSEEEMADAASGELSSIRRKIRAANGRIKEVLQKMITSQTYAKVLQEPIITTRSGRYVIPVRVEHKGSVSGLVHDISSSGQTVFIEPSAVVEANNEIRTLEAAEQKEIERILAEFSAEAAGFANDINRNYHLLVKLDTVFAKARLSYRMEASEPTVVRSGATVLRRARHPLLPRDTVVPVSIEIGGAYDTLVVTGPNTGGKTVTLKTLGLLSLMACCGLHVPAESGCRVKLYGGIYADIGDEQSIEQSLSTFSSHMTNIVAILTEAREDSLVLFDELGAGTDPVEGAALAVSIIEYARSMGAHVAATTHYAELKVYALQTEGVENASCEFDVETLKPTYRLIIGIPGKSNAFSIARRIGLPEQIIDRASSEVGQKDARFEDVITGLDHSRRRLETELGEAARMRGEAEKSLQKAREAERKLETEREKLLERARADARALVSDARASAEALYAELDTLRSLKTAGEAGLVNEARAELNRKLNEMEKKTAAASAPAVRKLIPPSRPIVAGDVVEILKMNVRGTVVTAPDGDGNLVVQAGILKINTSTDEVALLEAETKKSRAPGGVKMTLGAKSAATSLDLRGMTSEEALAELDRFLDTAVRSGILSATIIHGKGTGALRSAVTSHLRANRMVSSFRPGRYGEGDLGVTIVEF